ncbi:MAG TPA: aldose epimerase family protein [Planctomycetota bacterium]|nr:aldose epimerase family protein [Planctomycetota bacterium]
MNSIRWAIVTSLVSCASAEGGMQEEPKIASYTLTNAGGMTAKLTNYGTILTELHVPGRDGKTADVVLGFETPEDYLKGHPFFGATAGRVANRIGNASFNLDGKEYALARNNGPHTLHGGLKGFDKHVWAATQGDGPDGSWVSFSRTSPDGEEGFPGTVRATVLYRLTPRNELVIEMSATTDKPTLVNLANHTYWNLAGHGSGTILGQELQLHCDRYTPGDATLVPKGTIDPVAGTPYDFTRPKKIGQDLEKTGGTPVGYDTNFVVNGKVGDLRPAARVVDPASGRVMELLTTEPGVQFYTGNFLDGTVKGKDGAVYVKHAGFCLETQKYPDAIHHPDWPSPILRPGETYRHVMVHRFLIQK